MTSSNSRILFIDDEENLLNSYQRHFYKSYRVDVARGGEEGLKKLASGGPFAVVVSDFRMPGMNGVEVLQEIKQRSPDTIRIMLTGFARSPHGH